MDDFYIYCWNNFKVCFFVGVFEVGVFVILCLGLEVDVCIDVVCYNVYKSGILE